jgi:hypothetical protein
MEICWRSLNAVGHNVRTMSPRREVQRVPERIPIPRGGRLRPTGQDVGAGGRLRVHAGPAGDQPRRGRGSWIEASASCSERNGRANALRAMSATRLESWEGRPEGSSRRRLCKERVAGPATQARVRNPSPILHSRGGGGCLARTERSRGCTDRNDRPGRRQARACPVPGVQSCTPGRQGETLVRANGSASLCVGREGRWVNRIKRQVTLRRDALQAVRWFM